MLPKEKAKELFDSMYGVDDLMGNYPMCHDTAQKCALIAVDEIIIFIEDELKVVDSDITSPNIRYWEQVKIEIQKL